MLSIIGPCPCYLRVLIKTKWHNAVYKNTFVWLSCSTLNKQYNKMYPFWKIPVKKIWKKLPKKKSDPLQTIRVLLLMNIKERVCVRVVCVDHMYIKKKQKKNEQAQIYYPWRKIWIKWAQLCSVMGYSARFCPGQLIVVICDVPKTCVANNGVAVCPLVTKYAEAQLVTWLKDPSSIPLFLFSCRCERRQNRFSSGRVGWSLLIYPNHSTN